MAAFCEVEHLGSIPPKWEENKNRRPQHNVGLKKPWGAPQIASHDCHDRCSTFVFIISIFNYRVEWTKRARSESIDSHGNAVILKVGKGGILHYL